jgi:hypothetical protein
MLSPDTDKNSGHPQALDSRNLRPMRSHCTGCQRLYIDEVRPADLSVGYLNLWSGDHTNRPDKTIRLGLKRLESSDRLVS